MVQCLHSPLIRASFQKPRRPYLAHYKLCPGTPGTPALSLVGEEHTGVGESGAMGGAGCRDAWSVGSSEQGLSEPACGEAGQASQSGTDVGRKRGRC